MWWLCSVCASGIGGSVVGNIVSRDYICWMCPGHRTWCPVLVKCLPLGSVPMPGSIDPWACKQPPHLTPNYIPPRPRFLKQVSIPACESYGGPPQPPSSALYLICKIVICGKQELAAPRVGLISLSKHVNPSAPSELAAGHYCPSLPGARLPLLRVSITQRDIWL